MPNPFAQSAPSVQTIPAAPVAPATNTPAHDYQPPISWQERREKMLASLKTVLACIEAANSEDTFKGCANSPQDLQGLLAHRQIFHQAQPQRLPLQNRWHLPKNKPLDD